MKLKTLIALIAGAVYGLAQTPPQIPSTVELMQTRGAINTALAQIAPIACVGTPGNTTGAYGQQCQTTLGARYSCNNVAGCTVAADWVFSGSMSWPSGAGIAVYNGSGGWGTSLSPSAFEPALGNPGVSGYVLSSTTLGVRSWVAQSGGASSRTWPFVFQGFYQSGVVGFPANLPATNAPTLTSAGGSDPAGVLEWPCYTGGGCEATWSAAPYAWWAFTLPTGYVTNAAISYSIESRSTDSTHAAILTPSWGCIATATVDAPSWTAISTVNITGAAASGRVVTTGTITPTCAAGNRALIKFSINTNTNSMTAGFDLIAVTFSVQGGM